MLGFVGVHEVIRGACALVLARTWSRHKVYNGVERLWFFVMCEGRLGWIDPAYTARR